MPERAHSAERCRVAMLPPLELLSNLAIAMDRGLSARIEGRCGEANCFSSPAWVLVRRFHLQVSLLVGRV